MAVAFPPSPLDTSGNAAVNGSASLGPTSADAAVTNAPHSPHPSPADQLAALSPYSYSSCQAAATDAWRADLRSLFEKSGDRFADVSWTTSARQEHGTEEGEEGGRAPSPGAEDTIWAHKGEKKAQTVGILARHDAFNFRLLCCADLTDLCLSYL